MKEVLNFLQDLGVFYLATMDGEQPRVRPLGFVMNDNGRLIFCTSNDKNMCKQMMLNPNVEISCVDKDRNTLRICGRVVFCTTPDLQKKTLEYMPALKNIYSEGDGKFELFSLEDPQAICQSMRGERQTLTI
jgi:uncharacterized pyridoxamine 5'-phosphate oxidase family protein